MWNLLKSPALLAPVKALNRDELSIRGNRAGQHTGALRFGS